MELNKTTSSLDADALHVLLDVIAFYRNIAHRETQVYPPWTQYEGSENDLKTSEAGWNSILECAETKLTNLLNEAT